MSKARILIVDDQDGLNLHFEDFLKEECFEIHLVEKVADAEKKIKEIEPDLIVADVAKVEDANKLAQTIQELGAIAIWASKFEKMDLEDLPLMARILNKPFRALDLKYAIRSEFAKAKKHFDIY